MRKQQNIYTDFESNLNNLINKEIESDIQTPLKSFKQIKEELYLQSKKAFDDYVERLKRGIELLNKEKLLEGIDPVLLESLADRDFSNEKTPIILQKELNLSQDRVLDFYKFGQNLYQQKRIIDASDVLTFLTIVNPMIAPFWEALAMVEEAKQNLDGAIMAYCMALDLDSHHLNPVLSIARSFLALHKPEQARLVLNEAMKESSDSIFKEKVINLLKSMG